ncbi:MAG: type I-C CRISPR-associated protein Cas5c [Paludisphaera borealis]|uniref:type I-C CRISPR-associated protein Cas5c n=1 Tax=Paludisphaera borealis TaxID=1387353 RepID=UPI002845C0FA|nr:type I-C CRISPR-associated protein Cas5c [Paludisphaera borealis]MDR3618730.1 type I-C CRISPR-associated protein Cas5c [Paludisphaera borealis]
MNDSEPKLHTIDVWGDLACFSQPTLKVERFSWPTPTPSAAQGIFDSIYFHRPQFRWEVTRIEMLKLPRYLALRRNEVKETVNTNEVYDWMAGDVAPRPILADADKSMTGSDERGRTQRQTMALVDVRYRLSARIRPWPDHQARQREFDDQFERRLKSGKCFQQPYFGCREFVAFFGAVEPGIRPIAHDQDLGYMVYDVFDLSRANDSHAQPFISVFHAKIQNGVLDVPPYDDSRVLKPGR